MKFAQTHEWVKVSQDIGTVGISDHAQHELGEVVYVELPKVGKSVKLGEEVVVLESTKAATDIYSPVSGEIIEVNEILKQTPDLVNLSPEDNGWLYRVKLSNSEELTQLLDPESYRATLRGRR